MREKLFQLENGYYLLFYHRQKMFTMFLLYLRFMVPLGGLIYLIKKNPFYTTFPAMLPIMIVFLLLSKDSTCKGYLAIFRTVKYSRRTNYMVH